MSKLKRWLYGLYRKIFGGSPATIMNKSTNQNRECLNCGKVFTLRKIYHRFCHHDCSVHHKKWLAANREYRNRLEWLRVRAKAEKDLLGGIVKDGKWFFWSLDDSADGKPMRFRSLEVCEAHARELAKNASKNNGGAKEPQATDSPITLA